MLWYLLFVFLPHPKMVQIVMFFINRLSTFFFLMNYEGLHQLFFPASILIIDVGKQNSLYFFGGWFSLDAFLFACFDAWWAFSFVFTACFFPESFCFVKSGFRSTFASWWFIAFCAVLSDCIFLSLCVQNADRFVVFLLRLLVLPD